MEMAGSPPAGDKVGIKKGPWTPEEDIILVSYIQEHGPGNWRSVPTNTGLLRCSKSCRLRWTNYLRPGIKRGHFSDREEKIIIHLQALLGNRWSAIASYLPQRTDNDVKNYWNTHLKKKLIKLHNGHENQTHIINGVSKGQWERRLQTDVQTTKQALRDALSLVKPNNSSTESKVRPSCSIPFPMNPKPPSSYASSAENIARLLKTWMKTSPQTTTHNPLNHPGLLNLSTSESSVCLLVEEGSKPTFETGVFQDGSCRPGEVPLSLLEKWIFDDGQASNHELELLNLTLQDIEGMFN